jgi:hypothetical protein
MDRNRHMATRTPATTTSQSDEALRRVVADQIGPRVEGAVYDNAADAFRLATVSARDMAAAGFRPAAPISLAQASARYDIASVQIGQRTRWMDYRDLTVTEQAELRHARNELRRARTVLAAAGRLDLIAATDHVLTAVNL